jgi:polyhydroxyalkanoate synthase
VYSLVTKPYVFDLRPGNSLVERLLDRGFDVFLLDWGVPDAADSGNTLQTYCDEYLVHASNAVLRLTGAEKLSVFGYCFGAVLAMLFVAGHPEIPVENLILQTTPVNFSHLGPAAELFQDERVDPAEFLDETGNLPASVILRGMRMPHPTRHLVGYADLWRSLHKDEHLAAYQSLIGWSNDHIPMAGAVFLQCVDLFMRRNMLATGVIPFGERDIRLADIDCHVLNITAEHDDLVPTASSAALPGLLSGADLTNLVVPAGHVGLVVGRQAHSRFIPQTLDWLARHSRGPDDADPPDHG